MDKGSSEEWAAQAVKAMLRRVFLALLMEHETAAQWLRRLVR